MQNGKYGEAFELTSNNRVNLNVIVDYAWPKFLTHAEDFVREVQVSLMLCSDCIYGVWPKAPSQ